MKATEHMEIINKLRELETKLDEMYRVLDNKLTGMNSFYSDVMTQNLYTKKSEIVKDEPSLPKKKTRSKR